MKIRTKLMIGTAVTAVVVAVVVAFLIITTIDIRRLEKLRGMADELTVSILELENGILAFEAGPTVEGRERVVEAAGSVESKSGELEASSVDETQSALLTRIVEVGGSLREAALELNARGSWNETQFDPRGFGQALLKMSTSMLGDANIYRNAIVSNLLSAEMKETVTAVVVMLLLILLVVIAGVFLSVTVLRPLATLEKATADVAGGDLETRVAVDRDDEIGSLAGSFDRMVTRLQGSFAERDAEIRERRKAEQSLLEKNVQLESFAHTVSHDIRSPLASIGVGTHLMSEILSGSLDESARGELEGILSTVRSSNRRASELVDNILLLAEAGNSPVEVELVEVAEVVSSILDENARVTERKGTTFEVDDDLGRVRANRTHVYQVFSNLLNNAVKYGENEKPSVEVRNLGPVAGGGQRYLVRDNGPGIEEDALERIFAPFYRRREGGSGVGLAIVSNIVSAYGGHVKAYNDGGACFEFVLRDFEG